jgi:hypothetical protein
VRGGRSNRGATGRENKRALPSRRCSQQIRAGENRRTWVRKPQRSQKQWAVRSSQKTGVLDGGRGLDSGARSETDPGQYCNTGSGPIRFTFIFPIIQTLLKF